MEQRPTSIGLISISRLLASVMLGSGMIWQGSIQIKQGQVVGEIRPTSFFEAFLRANRRMDRRSRWA